MLTVLTVLYNVSSITVHITEQEYEGTEEFPFSSFFFQKKIVFNFSIILVDPDVDH